MEAGPVHVRSVLEEMGLGVLASTVGAAEMVRSEAQPCSWRSGAGGGQKGFCASGAH